MSHPPGASAALQTLYSDHHGWLLSWLRRRMGRGGDAADLVQETYVRVLLRRDACVPREPRAFLATIARGLLIDHRRRQALERAYLDAIARVPQPLAPAPESRELALELLEEIDRMLDGLRPQVRTAFLLAQLAELTHEQVAARMGVSLRSVERYVAEALYHCYRLRYER